MAQHNTLILLTGSTGYVGGRLLKALEERGLPVRCLSGSSQPAPPPVAATTSVVSANLLDPASLRAAMAGVHTAYYLSDRDSASSPFEGCARRAAAGFAAAAREAGVRRIVYLSGLSGKGKYSGHLCKPEEISGCLRDSGVPVIELQPTVIVGAGSLAFELVRAIVACSPVLTTPRWTRTVTRPIAIQDLVTYLVAAAELPGENSATYKVGGADRASFSDLIREFARLHGHRRFLIPLPFLTPRLSILWLSMIVPEYGRIGQELIAMLCGDDGESGPWATEFLPVRPMGFREAMQAAFEDERRAVRADQGPAASAMPLEADRQPRRYGPRIIDSRMTKVACPPAEAFQPILRIGGKTGWYYANGLWWLRGLLDEALGGHGMARSRPHSETLLVGDPVDFWRVEAIEPERLLRLVAEMKLPGRAWLQFEVEGNHSSTLIRQTAVFDPIGIPGLLYWYSLYPTHELIFPGMLRGIVRAIGNGDSKKPLTPD